MGDELVQVVAADAAQDSGITQPDLGFQRQAEPLDGTIGGALDVFPRHLCLQLGVGYGAEADRIAVREDDLQCLHVVERFAVDDRARSGGIIGDHAADGGAIGGGEIERQLQPVRLEQLVQFVEHDARLDRH